MSENKKYSVCSPKRHNLPHCVGPHTVQDPGQHLPNTGQCYANIKYTHHRPYGLTQVFTDTSSNVFLSQSCAIMLNIVCIKAQLTCKSLLNHLPTDWSLKACEDICLFSCVVTEKRLFAGVREVLWKKLKSRSNSLQV